MAAELRHRKGELTIPNINEQASSAEHSPDCTSRNLSYQFEEAKRAQVEEELQALKHRLVSQMELVCGEILADFSSKVEAIESSQDPRQRTDVSPQKRTRGGGAKIFVPRHSLLTELFEIPHIRTIEHVFVAIIIVWAFGTIVSDMIEAESWVTGLPDYSLLTWAFGRMSDVLSVWTLMQIYVLVLYALFCAWAESAHTKANDFMWATAWIMYEVMFLVIPCKYVLMDMELPPVSACILASEQTRFLMKMHSFVRENVPRVYAKIQAGEKNVCPDFGNYLYFLFAPTLIYRDSYPRTATVNWHYVATNFIQVFGCIMYAFYIISRFLVKEFNNFNASHVALNTFVSSWFHCTLPGTLLLLMAFFMFLHSWLNAFAEMLRFADRQFYRAWWNSTDYGTWYREWNGVVYDWLFNYIYKDLVYLMGNQYRWLGMTAVFVLSAGVHEYIIAASLRIFFPVLFIVFAGLGFPFILLFKGKSRLANILIWCSLMLGTGLVILLYSIEWYARQNCTSMFPDAPVFDLLLPRTFFCGEHGDLGVPSPLHELPDSSAGFNRST